MNPRRSSTIRSGFTLAELLVVIMVISILASSLLFAMYGAIQQAKESRTKTQITKLHELLMTRWDSYRTRAIRLDLTPAARRDARGVATARLLALRELMRLEMPDRIFDVLAVTPNSGSPPKWVLLIPSSGPGAGNVQPITPTTLPALPSLSAHYHRRAKASKWNSGDPKYADTDAYQGAECLYMIVSSIQDVSGNGLDFLHEGEIGDNDGDGMPEILDAWGNPIEFLRWAPGYFASPGLDGNWGNSGADDDGNGTTDDITEALWTGTDDRLPPGTLIDTDSDKSPDSFDPLRLHPGTYALYPLIYSAGPDGKYDIQWTNDLNYANLGSGNPSNNPYYLPSAPQQFPVGTLFDGNGDGELSFMDNITNHNIEAN